MSVHLKLEQFEGPLDLLCHLIDKHDLDIYDIQIALITEQYLQVLYELQELNLDLASEFLVMAATLLEIKSRMLLPQHDPTLEASEWEDPRTDLVARILEYRRYKHAAEYLKDLESRYGNRFFREPEDLDTLLQNREEVMQELSLETDLLVEALKRVLEKLDRTDTEREKYFTTLRKDPYTVEEKMTWITERLSTVGKGSFMALFEGDVNRLEVITTFLALLELMRGGRVKVVQMGKNEDLEILMQ